MSQIFLWLGARQEEADFVRVRYRSVDFIQKHIFPGGFLPSVTCLVDSVLKGTQGKLVVESIENIGPRTSMRTPLLDASFLRPP